jgi:hypothetical protein
VLAIDVTVTAACCSLCVRSPRASPAGSAAAPLTADDAAELRALAATAARPSVAAWLLDAAGSLEATSTTTTATAAPAHPAPIAVAAASPPPAAAAAARSYVEPSYGFSADGDDVEVLVMDLAGVGAIPRERVLFDVQPTSFDLRIHDLGGRHYRRVVAGSSSSSGRLRRSGPALRIGRDERSCVRSCVGRAHVRKTTYATPRRSHPLPVPPFRTLRAQRIRSRA